MSITQFPDTATIAFDNSYARLPDRFYRRQAPNPVASPGLVRVNVALAETLGIDPADLTSPAGLEMLGGNRVAEGSDPIALAYAGHQFGHFVPQLGDGRAVLLGEVVGRDGLRRDIQLKGSGRTFFSRGGDGRAALGPVLREYIVSEAMAALGVPTSRALAAVTTGEAVWREQPLPGAILTRVAASHIRVGTFQYFAARGDVDGLRALADHVMARHYPEAGSTREMLEGIVARQAALVAQWLLLGFIHGVMNTDNCAVSGETIDYGPCAFMDVYDPATVFSSIDQTGRYAYGNQPRIVNWNLTRLAETLLPLLHDNEDEAVASAQATLATFAPRFEAAYFGGLRRKIGISTEREGDLALTQELLKLMAENRADFTLTFRRLCDAVSGDNAAKFAGFDDWATRWRQRIADEPQPAAVMRAVNPAIIPRNHQVEAALAAAVEHRDFAPFEALLDATSRPFEDRPGFESYTQPPMHDMSGYQTFCGT